MPLEKGKYYRIVFDAGMKLSREATFRYLDETDDQFFFDARPNSGTQVLYKRDVIGIWPADQNKIKLPRIYRDPAETEAIWPESAQAAEEYQGPIQIRWEDGEIRFLDTVKEAFEIAQSHAQIWKISWTEGEYRIRLVRQPGDDLDTWKYEPLQSLPDEEGDNWRTQFRQQREESGFFTNAVHKHFFSNPDGQCNCGAFRYGSTDGDHVVLPDGSEEISKQPTGMLFAAFKKWKEDRAANLHDLTFSEWVKVHS